jgi:hypothetical protein
MSQLSVLRVAILLLCLALTACTHYQRNSATLEIASKVFLNVQTMPASMYQQTWQQVLYVTNQQQQHTVLSQLAVDNIGTVKLLMMTSQGMPLLELEKAPYQAIKTTKMLPGVELDATFVLVDIALVHWPISYLRQQLRGAVVEQLNNQRVIKQGDSTLISITYNGDTITLENSIREYKITFKKVTQ